MACSLYKMLLPNGDGCGEDDDKLPKLNPNPKSRLFESTGGSIYAGTLLSFSLTVPT